MGDESLVIYESMLKRSASMGLWGSLAYFGVPAAVLYVGTRVLVPALRATELMHPALPWFLVAGVFVFGPMFAAALFLAGRESEGWRALRKRLGWLPMDGVDWL